MTIVSVCCEKNVLQVRKIVFLFQTAREQCRESEQLHRPLSAYKTSCGGVVLAIGIPKFESINLIHNVEVRHSIGYRLSTHSKRQCWASSLGIRSRCRNA